MKHFTEATTQTNIGIPNAAQPHSNSLPALGIEFSLLGLALFGLIRQIISSKKAEWEANQALLEDLKDNLKSKDEEIEELKDEILTLKAQSFRLQKQNKSYERALYNSGFNQEMQPTTESIN